jgi:electron transfer flavoprotein beta subunit
VRIAVCVKEAPDLRVNPADRAALEVALRIREEAPFTRVEAFSVCEASQEGALRFAIGRGANHAERVVPDAANLVPPSTALRLAGRFGGENFDLICCGDETADNASAVVGPALAELLDLPQVTSVIRLREWSSEKLIVERGLERGTGCVSVLC